jgi:Cyclin-dependent kinase inhibitor 3 (CDKN3)
VKADPGRPIPDSYWVVPQKLLAGESPGQYDPAKTRQRLNALLNAGFDTFIDLKHPGELPSYKEILKVQATGYGRNISYHNFPISDRGLPSRTQMITTLDTIDTALSNGHKVYLHCWAGVGRTGTVIGCFLVRHGTPGQRAVEQIAEWWQDIPKRRFFPRSPETDEQVQFILDWVD